MASKNEIANTLSDVLTTEVGDFRYDEQAGIFDMVIDADDADDIASQFIVLRENGFVFYTIFNYAVPPERLPAMADFLMRANQGLPNGCFELDYGNELFSYKAYVPCYHVPAKQAVTDCFKQSIDVFYYYQSGIFSVLDGVDAETAMQGVEED